MERRHKINLAAQGAAHSLIDGQGDHGDSEREHRRSELVLAERDIETAVREREITVIDIVAEFEHALVERLQQSGIPARPVLHDRARRMAEAARGIVGLAQQFHQAHHEGEPGKCQRGTCQSAAYLAELLTCEGGQ